MKKLFVTAALLSLSLASATKVGDLAPNFKLTDSSGTVIELAKLKGQPVVLTFWATWCPSCKQELPEFNTALNTLGFKNHFAISPTDTSNDAWRFFADKGYKNIRALAEGKGTDSSSSVAKNYRIIGQPVTVFIDGAGKVAAQQSGLMSDEQYQANLLKTGFKATLKK